MLNASRLSSILRAALPMLISCRSALPALLLLFSVVGGRAQTATMTAGTSTYPAIAGQVTLGVSINYASVAAPTALGFTIELPSGWALVSTSGTNVPEIRSRAGDVGALEFAYASAPAGSASFTVVVSHPASMSGQQTIRGSGLYRSPLRNLTVPDVVLVSEASPPIITRQPASTSVAAGQAVSLTVEVSGSPVITYQWRRDGVALAGATSGTLNLGAVSTASAGSYDVVVTNPAGSVTSQTASLAVTAAVVPPSILVQPAAVSVAPGGSASFSVTAAGSAPLSYQWRKDGSPVAGGTDATLFIPAVYAPSAGSYSVVVSNAGGSVTSATAVLNVTAGASAPVISMQPVPQSVAAGGSATLAVVASGTAPLAYQWRKEGVAISGATSSTLALNGVTSVSAGSYSVIVSNSAGSVTSTAATLTVSSVAASPVVTTQPASQAVAVGGSATLSVVATGTAPLAYQWRKDGTAIAGATRENYALSSLTAAAAGSYTVVVSHSAGSVTPSPAAVSLAASTGLAGAVFGTFAADAGSFALWVRSDRTAVFLGFLRSGGRALLNRTAEIGADGRFQFPLEVSPAGGTVTGVSAVLSPDGSVSGSLTGAGIAISAPARAASMATSALAGYYAAGEPNGSSVAHTIVGAGGESYVLIVANSGAEAGRGTAGADGAIMVTTGSSTLAGSVQRENATLVLSSQRASGAPASFVGANDERRTVREKLLNISTRSDTTGAEGNALIAGFVIGGTTSKRVLVRAIGPSLAPFGVSGALPAARLELFRGQTSLAVSNDWGTASGASAVAAAAARLGAFALDSASRDAAVLVELTPGAYTAVMTGQGSAGGVGLVEVYDADETALAAQRIGNLASRGLAGSGDRTLTVGFVVGGTVPKRVLVRGVGPALSAFGVTGALGDPRLEVYREGSVIGRNDNWEEGAAGGSIAAASASVGAFALAAGSLDAALILNLFPGAYTAQVSGPGDQTGTALVEVYEVP